MHPNLFKINLAFINFNIKAYSFFLVLAALTVFLGSLYLAKKRNLPVRDSFWILLIMLFSVFVGARLFHFLLNFELYQNYPEKLWSISTQGFSLFGGILAAITSGFFACQFFKINVWKLGDTVIPFLGIGIALTRIGCFLNGCCFGKITNYFWGVNFPFFSQAHKYQLSQNHEQLFSVEPVHPTQIYELGAALLGSFVAFYILKKKLPDGVAFLIFGIWFSAFRWFNYYFRVAPPTFDASPNFYPIFYFAIICVCSYLLYNKLKERKI